MDTQDEALRQLQAARTEFSRIWLTTAEHRQLRRSGLVYDPKAVVVDPAKRHLYPDARTVAKALAERYPLLQVDGTEDADLIIARLHKLRARDYPMGDPEDEDQPPAEETTAPARPSLAAQGPGSAGEPGLDPNPTPTTPPTLSQAQPPGPVACAMPRVVVAGLLLLALADMPYGYYTFLRFACFFMALYVLAAANSCDRTVWAWTFGAVAVLFNPFIPVHLARGTWRAIDPVCAVLFLVSLAFVRLSDGRHPTKTPPLPK